MTRRRGFVTRSSPFSATARLAAVSSDIVQVLPQFRGYSYFATANEVYIVDAAANRVVAFFPVKLTATASRTPRGGAPDAMAAQPADTTASVSEDRPSRKSRKERRANELAGIEAGADAAGGAGVGLKRGVEIDRHENS